MSHPICHVHDVLAVFATIFTAAAAPLILANEQNSELLLLLLPLLGALLMTGAAILLNPEQETRKIVIGRSILAMLFGVAAPQMVAMFSPSFSPEKIKPVILVVVGAVFAFVAYVLSRPFLNQAYKRARGIAAAAADELARRAKIPDSKPEKNDPSN